MREDQFELAFIAGMGLAFLFGIAALSFLTYMGWR